MHAPRPQPAPPHTPPHTVVIGFTERRVPVRFIDAASVAQHMRGCLHGWEVTPLAVGDEAVDAPVTVTRQPDGYRVESLWLDAPVTGLSDVAAACCALIDVLECLLEDDPSLLCLHCAGAEIGGRLVVITGPSHAGKSTLAARLSAEDLVLYCDDMLPLDPQGRGIAVGLGPRLRLPLPPAASEGFRAHVARHMGPSDDRYGYLNAPTVADYGRRAPVGAIVLLDRRPEGPARLRRARPAEALGFLIQQNLASGREPGQVIERMRRLAAGLPCVRLEYSDLEDAAALIMRSFGKWPLRGLKLLPPRGEPLPPRQGDEAVVQEVDPGRRYRRRGDVSVRRFGGELFLAQAEERWILHLNEVGGAIWTLLEEPATPMAIAGDLSVAFPDVDPAAIEADVLRMIGEMRAHALVREAAGEGEGEGEAEGA